VVLANTRLAGALVVARKMLRQISEPMQVVGENGDLRMTLSVGVVEVKEDADIALQLKKADVYLYRAKKAGRNRLESGEVGGQPI